MGSYSGNIAYCIEPGTQQHTGDTLTENNESYFNNIPGVFFDFSFQGISAKPYLLVKNGIDFILRNMASLLTENS